MKILYLKYGNCSYQLNLLIYEGTIVSWSKNIENIVIFKSNFRSHKSSVNYVADCR